MTGTNKFLLIALVVQLGLVAIIHTRGGATSTIPDLAPIASGFTADSGTRVAIYGPDSGDQPSIALSRSGARWTVSNHHDYPADETKISSVLKQIESAETRRPVSTADTRHRQLRVADDEFERKVVISSGDSETVVFIGNPAGRNKTAVRVGGAAEVHGVSGLSAASFPLTAGAWVDTEYLKFDAAEVQVLGISNKQGSFELSRGDSGWSVTVDGTPLAIPEGKKLDDGAIDGLATDASDSRLTSPGAPADGLGVPIATVTIQRKKADEDTFTSYVVDVFQSGDTITIHDRQNQHTAQVAKTEVENVLALAGDKLVTEPEPDPAPAPAPLGPGALPPGLLPR